MIKKVYFLVIIRKSFNKLLGISKYLYNVKIYGIHIEFKEKIVKF